MLRLLVLSPALGVVTVISSQSWTAAASSAAVVACFLTLARWTLPTLVRRLIVDPIVERSDEQIRDQNLVLADLRARVVAVERQVYPNGGRSLADQVARVHREIVAQVEEDY